MKYKSETGKSAYRLLQGPPQRSRLLCTAAATVSVWLTGCAVVTTADGSRLPVASDRFAAYAEQVFREQNRVATALAFALEDAPTTDSEEFAALESAEESLLAACAGLNEVAAARRDGGRSGTRRQLRAAKQAPACEQATTEAEAVLARTGL